MERVDRLGGMSPATKHDLTRWLLLGVVGLTIGCTDAGSEPDIEPDMGLDESYEQGPQAAPPSTDDDEDDDGVMTSEERQRILATVGLLGISKWEAPILSTSSRRVTTVSQLRTALADANAGIIRRIVLAPGTYSSPGPLIIRRNGIQVMSETLHGAVISGQAIFIVDNVDDVLIMGIHFKDIVRVPDQRTNVIYCDSSERLRVTRIRSERTGFRAGISTGGPLFTVDYGSHDAQFDFNQVSFHSGLVIGVKSPGFLSGVSSKRVRIVHNEFRDIADPEGEQLDVSNQTENGEVVMLGLGYPDGHDQTIHATFEYNLMERALGDEEAVSVKSNGNTVRFNVMRDSNRASYNVRGGNDNVVKRNILEGGTKHGIGIAGTANLVAGNDIESTYPLLLQYESETYAPTVNATIAHNTFAARSYLIRLRQGPEVVVTANPTGNRLDNNTVTFADYAAPILDARSYMTWARFQQYNTVGTNQGLP